MWERREEEEEHLKLPLIGAEVDGGRRSADEMRGGFHAFRRIWGDS